ncbi:DUF4393 domain-containing protein [Bacillus sp. FJAT-27445]|uniref:DUF4393 domain-containing protein n=1 Tax=Bacillus sp. FJAT-27445 TaxID=1679166 RepID=UPI00074443B5|nr:DUF4393 domain-containing protein [Bacillus sp. FJAT-27445]
MSNGFKLFSIIPDSTKEEALNPATNLIGQAFRGIAHKVLDPLVKYNIVKDKEMEDFITKIRTKTDIVPVENRDSSKLGLTLKAVEDGSYQLNSEILRDMFSNLISATVDNRKNDVIKPSFSSILKDLSPIEASLFETISKVNRLPLVTIRIENDITKEGLDYLKNILLLNNKPIHDLASLNSLQRLGLIEVSQHTYLIAPQYAVQYDNFLQSTEYKEAESKLPIKDGDLYFDSVRLNKGKIELTALGEEFGNIVIS